LGLSELDLVSGVLTLVTTAAALAAISTALRKTRESFVDEAGNFDDEKLQEQEKLVGAIRGYQRFRMVDNTWKSFPGVDANVHTDGMESLYRKAVRNTRIVDITVNGRKKFQYILGIKGNFALINTHAIEKCPFFELRVYHAGRDGSYVDVQVQPSMKALCGLDQTLLYLPKVTFKDISMHLASRSPTHTIGYAGDEEMKISKVELEGEYSELGSYYMYTGSHFVGKCGMPVIGETTSGKYGVIGMHTGGYDGEDVSIACPLSREAILQAMDGISVPVMKSISLADEAPLQVPTAHSPFKHESFTHIEYLGRTEEKVCVKNKSKMEKIPIYDAFTDLLWEEFDFVPTIDYVRPVMEPGRRNGEWMSPFNVALRKIDTDSPNLNYTLLGKVMKSITSHVIRSLEEKGVSNLRPLILSSAINGYSEDDYLRRVKTNTAAGSKPGNKARYLPLTGSDDPDIMRGIEPKSLQEYTQAVDNYINLQVMANERYKACLKDEPRDSEKVAKAATRLFYPNPFISYLISRAYLSSFYTLMVEHSGVFGAAIGKNVHKESESLYESLSRVSDNIIEGDYSGYDVSMPIDVALAASQLCMMYWNILVTMNPHYMWLGVRCLILCTIVL
jgi:hypothetical protein